MGFKETHTKANCLVALVFLLACKKYRCCSCLLFSWGYSLCDL